MLIKLSPKTREEVSSTIEDYGYKGIGEFVEDALRHRILELKKTEFLIKIRGIRGKMRKVGITEKELLEDFDKFLHRK